MGWLRVACASEAHPAVGPPRGLIANGIFEARGKALVWLNPLKQVAV
jgi:hypothetical protein